MMVFSLAEKDREFVQHLLGDTLVATILLEKNKESQFARRTYVRAFFAFCEGFGNLLRADLIRRAEAGQMQFDMAKLTFLTGKTIRISEAGKIEAAAKEGFYRTLNFFAFTIRTVLEAIGENPTAFFGDNGWRSFRDALDIRDRLTHPKMENELAVTDDDLTTLTAASVFILGAISRYLGIDVKNLPGVDFRLNFTM